MMIKTERDIDLLELELDNLDPDIRSRSLNELLALVDSGDIQVAEQKEVANLHCHTFFSFNAYGYSPTHIAWLALKNGYRFMGMVDFDVLDGVDEFLQACEIAGICGSAGMETRVFIPEFLHDEINSPGEPGIAYHMGVGFSSGKTPEKVKQVLDDIRGRVRHRNQAILAQLNPFLSPLSIDYEHEVLPLTPSGNATERHIVKAMINKVRQTIPNQVAYWSEKLLEPQEKISSTMQDEPGFQNLVRLKLMKHGGAGYIQPDPSSFPLMEEFNQAVRQCGALPCLAWLDGTSSGEQRIQELLDLVIAKGVVAINIIPERNWNIADPNSKEIKLKNLYQIVDLVKELDLPIIVGTEMNSFGQKLVDEFNTPELAPLYAIFMEGANFIYGHTVMERTIRLGYQSPWAEEQLPGRRERNIFYITIGKLVAADSQVKTRLMNINSNYSPQFIIDKLKIK